MAQQREWEPLNQLELEEERNPDVETSVAEVRRVLRALSLRYLNPNSVLVDARPQLRAAIFRFPHTEDRQVFIEFGHGDGYTWLRTPLGKYDGWISDDDLGELVEAVLTGRLFASTPLHGWPRRPRLHWTDANGKTHWLGREPLLRRLFYRQAPETSVITNLSFDRLPAVMEVDEETTA